MSTTSCPHCGAARISARSRCLYCGGWLEPKPKQSASNRIRFWQQLLEKSTFGLSNRSPIIWVLIVAVVLSYAIGWMLEDPTYWLADNAILVWAGIVPLFMACLGFAWQLGRPAWGVGLWFAFPFFALHLGIMWGMRGHFNDDYLGIAAMFAGIALVAWWIGRGVHIWAVSRQQRDPVQL